MKFLIIIGFVFTFTSLHAQENQTSISLIEDENKAENLTILQRWQKFESGVKKSANAAVKMLLPRLMENQGKINISSQCMREGMQLIGGLKNIKTWAFRFVDSSAKVIDGLLLGSMSSFGDYEECVDTVATSDRSRDKGKVLFRGKYCSLDITPPLPPKKSFYKLDEVLDELKEFSEGGNFINEASKYAHFFHFLKARLGICVPSGCSLEDIKQVAKSVGGWLGLNVNASRCEVREEKKFPPLRIAIITLYSFAGLLLFIGSMIDLYAYYSKASFKSTAVKVLLAFSLITNFRKFSNTKTSSDTLSCLNGIRFLCMTWIVLGHTYLNVNFQMFIGLEKTKQFARDFAFQAVINASVAVDTFFCIGGLLVSYLTVKLVMLDGHPFNIKLYIFHRLWRILPVYSFVIMFMFLGDLLGSGPLWYDSTNKYIVACHENWWTNILFINNFYNPDNMCIPQSWYIACDVQMYFAALLILLPLLRWPKVGLSMCVGVIIASILYCGIETYVKDYPPTMLFQHPDPDQRIAYWAFFYFRPFVHASPYCIGLIIGYILAVKPDLKIPRLVQLMGWSLAFIFNFSVLYGVVEWNRGVEPTLWGGLLYASLNRTAWTLGVAWMIVCCATGHGGVINYILSWKAFVPLGRLTFIVYLIHPVVQIAVVGNIRTKLQPDHFFAVWVFFGHVFVTYSTAFAGSMLIESPMMALEKLLFGRNNDKKTIPDKNGVLNGTLTSEKNGDIAVIVPKESEEPLGIDNATVVYRL